MACSLFYVALKNYCIEIKSTEYVLRPLQHFLNSYNLCGVINKSDSLIKSNGYFGNIDLRVWMGRGEGKCQLSVTICRFINCHRLKFGPVAS